MTELAPGAVNIPNAYEAKRRKITLMWLYHDLLDMHGDSGNLLALQSRLREIGYEVEIVRRTTTDALDFTCCDMAYIGPGRPKNLLLALDHMLEYRDAFFHAVDKGKLMLFVGNSRAMLGQRYRAQGGQTVECLGLFGYTAYETGQVFTRDVTAKELMSGEKHDSYGFISRTCYLADNSGSRMFSLKSGAGDDDEGDGFEGNIKNNLFATWMLGPLLIKNPHITADFVRRLTGMDGPFDDKLENVALQRSLEDFGKKK